MSEKHLERKEVLNLVYTQQADAMANAYARLKAEVDTWKLRSNNWQKFCELTRPEMTDELTRLKAEVERLNTGIQPEGSNDAVGRAVNVLLEKEKEIARLKAEVEHLQSENLLVREEADRYCRLWQEAKEGKQS